ncbi:MAG: sugar ABC transporter permease [Phycisphaeraceae bacterium]|nr:MAG: sugar ABC transporter permease [Phycisphaeraceae bacterium]
MTREGRENLAGWVWVSPWVIGFGVFMLLPMAMSLYYSFTEYPMLEGPVWVGAENYARMLGDGTFWKTLWNTAWYGAVVIPLATALSLVIAGMLTSKVRAGGLFQAAVFIPTLVPLVASAMIWMWLFNGRHGLVNRALGLVGVDGPVWLERAGWAACALVIIALWGVGQQVMIYCAALREVPESLYEAADLDGMGPVRRFVSVTLPMISPVILFNVITLTIGTLQVFALPLALFQNSKGGPGQVGYFYTMYMFDKAFADGEMGYASALAWVQLVLVLGLTWLMFKVSGRVVHTRG